MRTMSVDSGALAYVQSPGTATPPGAASSSDMARLPMSRTDAVGRRGSSPYPPPTLMGGGELTGETIERVFQFRHESVSLSVEGEVVAALVRARALLAELHEDVVEERRRAEPVQVGSQPVGTQRLVHEDEVLDGLLRLPDPARRLEPD